MQRNRNDKINAGSAGGVMGFNGFHHAACNRDSGRQLAMMLELIDELTG